MLFFYSVCPFIVSSSTATNWHAAFSSGTLNPGDQAYRESSFISLPLGNCLRSSHRAWGWFSHKGPISLNSNLLQRRKPFSSWEQKTEENWATMQRGIKLRWKALLQRTYSSILLLLMMQQQRRSPRAQVAECSPTHWEEVTNSRRYTLIFSSNHWFYDCHPTVPQITAAHLLSVCYLTCRFDASIWCCGKDAGMRQNSMLQSRLFALKIQMHVCMTNAHRGKV